MSFFGPKSPPNWGCVCVFVCCWPNRLDGGFFGVELPLPCGGLLPNREGAAGIADVGVGWNKLGVDVPEPLAGGKEKGEDAAGAVVVAGDDVPTFDVDG